MGARGGGGRRATPAAMAMLAAVLAALALPPGAAADRAYNILPPGQFGGLPFTENSRDQLALYDALTPKLGNVTAQDLRRLVKTETLGAGRATPPPTPGTLPAQALRRLFKPETLGPVGSTTTERTARSGLTIRRDRFGVPH